MQITLQGTAVTIVDSNVIGFQNDNLTNTFSAIVDTTSEWSYKLDIYYGTNDFLTNDHLCNTITLTRTENTCSVALTKNMMPIAGKWRAQLRGLNGDKVYHSDIFYIQCKTSIDVDKVYNRLPSEFEQAEQKLDELNNHPPIPGSTGYWLIWDTGLKQYIQSTIPCQHGVPDISAATNGKYLSNDGTNANWSSISVELPIKKSDLATDVQASLDKADTAIQSHQSLAAYRTSANQDTIDNGKVDKIYGKGLSTEDFTTGERVKLSQVTPIVKTTTLTAWNQDVLAGTVTPGVVLPTPDTTKIQSLSYTFTAATTSATFTAPVNWILCDSEGAAGLSAGNAIAYTELTIGSIYECSFKPVSDNVIRLVMVETKMA